MTANAGGTVSEAQQGGGARGEAAAPLLVFDDVSLRFGGVKFPALANTCHVASEFWSPPPA